VCPDFRNSPSRLASLRPREWQLAVFPVNRRIGTCVSRKHTITRPRMAHVTCPECGEEVSEPASICSQCDAPPAKASRAATRRSVPAPTAQRLIRLPGWPPRRSSRSFAGCMADIQGSEAFRKIGGCEVRSRTTGWVATARPGRATADSSRAGAWRMPDSRRVTIRLFSTITNPLVGLSSCCRWRRKRDPFPKGFKRSLRRSPSRRAMM